MDNEPYIEIYKRFCKLATTDGTIFKAFKSHPDYVPMLEHVSPSQGFDYLKIIQDRNPTLLEHMEKFRENDKLGSPNTTEYRNVGVISPTTLRYVKTLSDMMEMFETLDDETIIELGAGYGGQCKIISCVFNPKSYTIVDLPEVVGLINRYLAENKVPQAKAITLEQIPDQTWGLFISNYAFTELPIELQRIYIEKVINKCTHGYITCNFTSEDCGVSSLSKTELLSEIKHECIELEEFPKTHPKNCMLVW